MSHYTMLSKYDMVCLKMKTSWKWVVGKNSLYFVGVFIIKQYYYINTNEIPGELSHENLISSNVKITCYPHMWKYHHCYGYIINRAFHTKKLLKWNGLVFHWCLYNNWNITWPLGDSKFLFECWKNISLVRCSTREIFFNTQREISYLHAAM